VGKKLLIYSHSDLQAFSEPASFCYSALLAIVMQISFFFCGEFSPLGNKKKRGLTNLTKEILKVFFLNRHILRKKKDRSRQI
jgi:hypothetical protein